MNTESVNDDYIYETHNAYINQFDGNKITCWV